MAITLERVLYAIGVVTLAFYIYSLISFIHLHTRKGNLHRYLHPSKPSWALITGASDGVGFGFAKELASSGFNIILHGRNATKLEDRKKDLLSQFPKAEVELAVVDASSLHPIQNAEAVAAVISDKHLTVLINNLAVAAVSQRVYKTVDETTEEEIEKMASLNIRFFTHLARLVSPILKRNQPGLVINIGSLGGRFFMQYLQLYTASKAYQLGFSAAMNWEMKQEDIDVEVLGVQLGMVNTLGNPTPVGLAVPSARGAARAALQKVGYGSREVVAYWVHDLQATVIGWFPENIQEKIIRRTMQDLVEAEDKKLKDL